MIIAGLLGFALPVSVFAQNAPVPTTQATPTDPMVAYAAYNAAIEAGNLADAAAHAMTAWRAAETTWGASNPNTGGLAYNAAWTALLMNRAQDAIEPARRAVAMATIPEAAYKIEEAEFLLAYAEFQVTTPEQRERLVNQFVNKIEKVGANWGDFLIVNALNSASNTLLLKEYKREAREYADQALAQLIRLELDLPLAKATALFNRGRAQLYLRNYREAVSDLIEARIAYGLARSETDKTWGQLAAWEAAAISLARSDTFMPRNPTGTNITGVPASRTALRVMTTEERRAVEEVMPEYCRGISFQRDETFGREIVFPTNIQSSGSVAGVLARLKIADDGKVEKVDILGVVPNESFSDNAKEAVLTWRYNFTPNYPSECHANYLLRVHFIYPQ